MKYCFIFIFISIIQVPQAWSSSLKQNQIITDALDLYREEITEKFAGDITVKIKNSVLDRVESDYQNRTIEFYTGALQYLPGEEVVRVTCHELGHFLGDNSRYQTDYGAALEGEADYFSGSCMVRYFEQHHSLEQDEAQDAAWDLTQSQMRRSSGISDLSEESAYSKSYTPGVVEVSYPDWDCRLLTVKNGIYGGKRPVCWYNP